MILIKAVNTNREDTIEMLKRIQNGDVKLREKLIKDYTPFVLKTIAKFTGKFIEPQNSEEFSIGLMAFNEAIDSFDRTKATIYGIFPSK